MAEVVVGKQSVCSEWTSESHDSSLEFANITFLRERKTLEPLLNLYSLERLQ